MDEKQKDSADYCDTTLEQQITSVSACLEACIIPKEHCASVFFAMADVKFLGSVVCMIETISKIFSLFPKAQ